MSMAFNLQGHRGARGLKPENTLPAFEAAFDLGVTSVETDLHLTWDGVPVLIHDPAVGDGLYRLGPGSASPPPSSQPPVRSLTLALLRGYRADGNPDPRRFPDQDPGMTRLARLFAEAHGLDAYAPPSLADLFAFAGAYTGPLGERAGKTEAQRDRARRLLFDLELKRVPFHPERIGDDFDGTAPGLLEQRVVEVVRAAEMMAHTSVRSFDHRCVLALRRLEPGIAGAVLVAGAAPVAPAFLARQADAVVYCPDVEFLDRIQVRQAQAEGIRVLPWTVNDPDAWSRLLDWGVDGITTDFPDRLAEYLQKHGVAFG
jgi:glycerophosphoryl diester phosphodiesterase